MPYSVVWLSVLHTLFGTVIWLTHCACRVHGSAEGAMEEQQKQNRNRSTGTVLVVFEGGRGGGGGGGVGGVGGGGSDRGSWSVAIVVDVAFVTLI